MIVVFRPNTDEASSEYIDLRQRLAESISGIQHLETPRGKMTQWIINGHWHKTEISNLSFHPLVQKVIETASKTPLIAYDKHLAARGFEYQGLQFNQETCHLFAGLCAVDTIDHAEEVMRCLADHGLQTTRMGVYKPRTNPYTFQGLGQACLPSLFEKAGKHGIKVIAMEVMSPEHILEIDQALALSGHPTGVMLQVGTRNCQNFSLLAAVGRQHRYPVLLKRGFGLELSDALSAAEHIALAGNPNIIFCLRGIQSHTAAPHRNLADFAQVSVVKRLTRLPVCIDPSHALGTIASDASGIPDIAQATAQGIIAGANMILLDIHPDPKLAYVDGHQALTLSDIPKLLKDIRLLRASFEQRCAIWSS